MFAYLLCAGFGTRMGRHTGEMPKSLLPVGGRPILDYLVDELRQWEALDSVHVAVNERDEDAFLAWASEWKSRLRTKEVAVEIHSDGVSKPEHQLGAVGDLRFLLEKTGLPEDGALVSGGDSLYRFPLAPILNAFDGQPTQVLALHEPNEKLRRQSSTLILDNGRVTGLREQPEDANSNRICPSWYLFSPSALQNVGPYLENGRDPDTLGALIDALAQKVRIEAITLPEMAHLRIHCNTPSDLETARAVLRSGSRFLLDEEDVRNCLRR